MTETDGPILYDRDYVKTCLEKVIESKPAGYRYSDGDLGDANRYFDWGSNEAADEVTPVPACLIGHMLGDIGVSEQTMSRILRNDGEPFNGMGIRDLVAKLELPVTSEAVELLSAAQEHSDYDMPWDQLFK